MPDAPDRVKALFHEALERPPHERDAFLAERCGTDVDLRAETQTLLAHFDDAPAQFLDGQPSSAEHTALPHTPLPSPDIIPGYRILKELHRGGQGVVYQALQESTKRKVALKVMLEGPFAGAASKRRFEREIELVGSLDHPGIVPIFDSGVAHGRFYYAMRYVRGESLSQYVHGRALSVDDTLGLFVKVCDAVDHAHQRGVIHRDLKPANILVDDDGQPHIVDFGLARIGGPDSERDRSLLISVTGQIMGTLAYMSPEQAAGRSDQVDMRSDVYALGVVLYTTNLQNLVAPTRFQAANSANFRGLALRAAFKATTRARPLSVSW